MTVFEAVRIPALAAALGIIGYMVVSLARGGDERREMILAKAALHTLVLTAVAAGMCAVRNLVETDLPHWRVDPFAVLLWLAVCFAVELFYWRRRYGG